MTDYEKQFNLIATKVEHIIKNNIKGRITSGLVNHERQLQAELYFHLRSNLPSDYIIWVEQVLNMKPFDLQNISPDLMITHRNSIISIFELKFLIYGRPNIKNDLKKLIELKRLSKDNPLLFSNLDFNNSLEPDIIASINRFTLIDNFLGVLIAFGTEKCDTLDLNCKENKNNFLQVAGYYSSSNLEIEITKY